MRDGSICEPEAGGGDLRFAGVSVYRSQHASGSRHDRNVPKRFLKQLKPLFVQILLLARTMGFLNLGKISLDGSKVQANASKHNALSWGHATELEQQLKAEVARFVEMAAAADEEVPEG